MNLLVCTVLGACAMVIGYAIGIGGPVCGVIFSLFLLIGITLYVLSPSKPDPQP